MNDFENNAIITSPCFSCGMGHIMEVMLLLNVRVNTFGSWADNHWIRDINNTGWQLSKTGYNHYRGHSKHVSPENIYNFPDKKSILIEHNPHLFHNYENYRKTILLVRDPIDAIYSWHRRFKMHEKGLDFNSYLKSTLYFNNHHPFSLFQGRPLDIFALYCAFWLGSCEELIVVRFEDLKNSTFAWKKLLHEIGIDRSEIDILSALKLSSGSSSDNIFIETNIGGGVFYEYKKRMSDIDHDQYLNNSFMKSIAQKFGYTNLQEPPVEIFKSIDTKLANLMRLIFKNIEEKNQNSEYFNFDELAKLYNDLFFKNLTSNINFLNENGYIFQSDDFKYVICHKTVMRFLAQLYAKRKVVRNKSFFRTYSTLTSFLHNTISNDFVYSCMHDRFFSPD